MKSALITFSLSALLIGPLITNAQSTSNKTPLSEFSQQLVLPTYQSLAERSGILVKTVKAVVESPSAKTVTGARQAWVATREPWEMSEAFLFGPVDTEGHDPNLDSWPVNVTDLKKVINPTTGPETLDVKAVESLSEGARGFHVVEYLLFADLEGQSISPERTAELLKSDPRRGAYLIAATEALDAQADALLADYAPSGKNFVGEIAKAGTGSEVYLTHAAALSEIVNAMAGIADESSQEKLLAPAEASDVTLLESRFSGNTLTDVLNNIAGIQRAAVIIQPVLNNETLQTELTKAVSDYQASVEAIPATFNQKPGSTKSAVEKAAVAGAALRDLIEQKIVPAVRQS